MIVLYFFLMVLCVSTAEEVSFEWSHHRISSTDLRVRTALHVSITDFGSKMINANPVLLKIYSQDFISHVKKVNKTKM